MRIHAEIFNININIIIIIINLARQFNTTAKIDGDCFPRSHVNQLFSQQKLAQTCKFENLTSSYLK